MPTTAGSRAAHSFSFADYHDPRHMGFGNLRVINEDRIAPGSGFGTHGHRDMEIVSYVLSGELAHKDSIGTGAPGSATGVIRPGDVQRMSAGRGVQHSEFNHAPNETTHFLQIWIEPNERGIAPSYEQKHFDDAAKRGTLRLVASPDGRDGSVTIHADASISAGLVRRRGSDRARARPEAQDLRARRPRQRRRQRPAPRRRRRRRADRREPARDRPTASEAEVLVFDLACLTASSTLLNSPRPP